jgi:hypothetical protein
MKKKSVLLPFGAVLFAPCVSTDAQQPTKAPRIGYLSSSDAATASAGTEGIRLALRELGYIEGQKIAIEHRYEEGKLDRHRIKNRLSLELVG